MTAKKICTYNLIIILVLAIFGINGCGYKTMPVPPAEIVPKAISDLRYELTESGVTLSWTFPEETVKGETLMEITSFKLFRAVVPADKYCENCPIPFGEPILVEGGAVAAGKVKTGVYTTTLLRPGHLYFFKIRSGSGWWAESSDSNTISFMWDIPPALPKTLDATVADGKVTLRWSPVTTRVDGATISTPVKYQVFRSNGGGFAPIGELQSGQEYVDDQVVNNKQYQYKIQAVSVNDKGQIGGGMSSAVEAIPVDQTPPPVPSGIQGIRTANGVKIIWSQVEAVDLVGYRIYRRLPGETKAVKVGEVYVPNTLFDDTSMPDSDEWFYSVSSFDKSKPVNESELSAEVEVRN